MGAVELLGDRGHLVLREVTDRVTQQPMIVG
jgi:hypothetical protein